MCVESGLYLAMERFVLMVDSIGQRPRSEDNPRKEAPVLDDRDDYLYT